MIFAGPRRAGCFIRWEPRFDGALTTHTAPLPENLFAEVVEHPEISPVGAFHGSGARRAPFSEAGSVSLEKVLHKGLAAQHHPGGEVTHSQSQQLWEREFSPAFDLRFHLFAGESGTQGEGVRPDKLPDLAFSIQQEAVGGSGLFPVFGVILPADAGSEVEDASEAGASPGVPRHGGGVAAPTVFLDALDDPGAQGIEIDIGGDREEGLFVAFDQDAGEAILPQSAFSPVAAVEPDAEALFELLHEGGEVAHLAAVAVENLLLPLGMGACGGPFELGVESIGTVLSVESRDAPEDFIALESGRGEGIGSLEQEVEMIGEDAVGEDADAVESGDPRDEFCEKLFFPLTEEPLLSDDAGEAMVVGGIVGFATREAHGDEIDVLPNNIK